MHWLLGSFHCWKQDSMQRQFSRLQNSNNPAMSLTATIMCEEIHSIICKKSALKWLYSTQRGPKSEEHASWDGVPSDFLLCKTCWKRQELSLQRCLLVAIYKIREIGMSVSSTIEYLCCSSYEKLNGQDKKVGKIKMWKVHLWKRTTWEQVGFRTGRCTAGSIFTLKQLQEKAVEQQFVFVDFFKAFDTFDRDTLWKILKACGSPEFFYQTTPQWHDS